MAPLADTIAWRDYFADERLRQVIALALDNNRDLRIAALNIERARAQYGIQRADLFPSIAVSGGQSAQRGPGDLSMSGGATGSRCGRIRRASPRLVAAFPRSDMIAILVCPIWLRRGGYHDPLFADLRQGT